MDTIVDNGLHNILSYDEGKGKRKNYTIFLVLGYIVLNFSKLKSNP